MNIEDLLVQSQTDRKSYTADHIISVLDGSGIRGTMIASYLTPTINPEVWYTSIDPDGNVLIDRTTAGVTFTQGFYTYAQAVEGLTEFIAIWDEGDPDIFTEEWIVVAQ